MGAVTHDDSAEVKNVSTPAPAVMAPQPAEAPVPAVPVPAELRSLRPDITIKDVLTEVRERLMVIIGDINDKLASL